MRGRALVEHAALGHYSPVFLTALLLSAALWCWWLAAWKPDGLDSAGVAAHAYEDETDAALAQAARVALGEREGTLIVMDPQTGRLRAVVNSRTAFEQAFSPGSTIKPFTALAAMQEGLINEQSRLLCRTPYAKDDFEIACSHPEIAAPFDVVEALAYSCNYYFGKLGERLDEASFKRTLVSFGMGARATRDGDEREALGNLPRGVQSRASHALGEGKELLVTPAQLITAYAALANGGHLYAPREGRAREFKKEERRSVRIAPAHRALLIKGMRGAVVYGTAERAALSRLPLYLFGKTGTATAEDNLHTQGWFIGFASEQGRAGEVRAEDVKLAVLVFLKNAHGAECAESARPVFEAFVKERNKSRTATGSNASIASPPSSNAQPSGVRVYLAREDRTVSVSLEDYVLGVVAAEGAIEDEPEALKALAVAVRTYAVRNLTRHERDGYDFCNTTHCQRFTFTEDGARSGLSELIRRAVTETAGEVLLDESGRIADASFHAACGGRTANVETLWGGGGAAYLRGVGDEYCASMPHREWTDVIPATQLAAALRSDARTDAGARLDNVVISRRDQTGRAELITLEGERRRVVRGWDFKIIVGRALGWNVLKSSRFEVKRAGSNFIFRGGGFGHGVGLCQEGAHVMARRGILYRQILNFYFPGTGVGTRARDVERAVAPSPTAARREQRNGEKSLTGEHFNLSYPANCEQREAESVLRDLEAARADVLRRVRDAGLRFDEPQKLYVIIHPTTGDFTSATGQPWWAAAAIKAGRIELQPVAVLNARGSLSATLRHEYTHAVIDALSLGRAPRWLAEGLALHVAGEGTRYARVKTNERLTTALIEQKLSGPLTAEEMRLLYAAAYQQVQALIRLQGESGVWQRVAQRE